MSEFCLAPQISNLTAASHIRPQVLGQLKQGQNTDLLRDLCLTFQKRTVIFHFKSCYLYNSHCDFLQLGKPLVHMYWNSRINLIDCCSQASENPPLNQIKTEGLFCGPRIFLSISYKCGNIDTRIFLISTSQSHKWRFSLQNIVLIRFYDFAFPNALSSHNSVIVRSSHANSVLMNYSPVLSAATH